MNHNKIFPLIVSMGAILLLFYILYHGLQPKVPAPLRAQISAVVVTNAAFAALSNSVHHVKVKTRYAEFTDAERSEFDLNFENRYKPALSNWCNAYNGHLPFSSEAVTKDKFVERVGINSAYREYVFVVDGITLGIQDTSGQARVDYLNNPVQTKKMAMLPDGTAPIIQSPVPRTDVIFMLAAECGTQFPPDQVKLVPSGFSGGLNGGVLVHVGGTPDNAASWKYDYVFGRDGKLAYYLKGH